MNKDDNVKIAWFFPSVGKIGGAERRLTRIMTKLNSYGIQSCVVLHVLNNVNPQEIEEKYRAFCTKDVEIKCFYKASSIIKFLREMRFDWICYTDCYFRAFPAILGGILSKSKRLMLNVTTFSSSFKEKSWIKKITYSLIVLQSTQLDCLYPSSTEILRKKFSTKKITTTPGSFTDLEKFKPRESDEKENLILFAGRLITIKHPELLAQAIVLCQDIMREKRYRCMICGEGELSETIKDILKSGHCEDLMSLPGNINTDDIMASVKIFCSLQEVNNYPSQSLLEALACGCYCIATDEGDTSLIVKKEFGKLIGFSAEQLKDALIEAMDFSNEKRKKIEQSARDFACENFKIDKSVIHYSNIFNN